MRMRYQKVSMLKRRVTVHFGPVRVVVPCPDEQWTVADMAEAALLRYRKATGRVEADIRIIHLECIRDGGILDPDDRLVDVFDENSDQILAIYDEQTPNGSMATPSYHRISSPMTSSYHSAQSSSSNAAASSPMHHHLPRYTASSSHASPSSSTSTSVYAIPSTMTSPLPTSSSMEFVGLRRAVPYSVSSTAATTTKAARSPVLLGRVRDSVVEITSLSNPPTNGLRVSGTAHSESPPLRSSMRSDGPSPTKQRVTLSPEVEKRLAEGGERDTRLTRSSARKSRISESFFDAKERLEESQELAARMRQQQNPTTSGMRRVPIQVLEHDPENSVIVFPDEDQLHLGIEITGIFVDESSTANGGPSSTHDPTRKQRLSSVEIIRIDPEGRVGRDGRLRVGDNIVAIDGRPVYQMTVLRARAYLSDLHVKPAPSLTVARHASTFVSEGNEPDDSQFANNRNETATSSQRRQPIFSALQQANTQAIGDTMIVKLTKANGGFGFTVTGRETATGRLFLIGTVKPNGIALGRLKSGDRLLEINGEVTSDLTQMEVVDRLKNCRVGETASLLISRVVEGEDKENRQDGETSEQKGGQVMSSASTPSPVSISDGNPRRAAAQLNATSRSSSHSERSKSPPAVEELELVVPLNNTGSAGLGLSLKARVTVRSDQSREDCGIFIKKVLNGGAAHKDGRLRVDDRIVGIEELRLLGMSNAVASESVSKRLKQIGADSSDVRLIIHRRLPLSLSEHEPQLGGSLPTPSPISLRESHSSADLDKRSSLNSEITRLDESELPAADPFDREAATRKSMSERRGMGAALDPSGSKLYQDIKHQRQSSAPPTSSMASSFHGQSTGRSASQRAAARVRSQSVHPRASNPPSSILKQASGDAKDVVSDEPPKPKPSAYRRSLSVESISRQPKYEKHSPYMTGGGDRMLKKVNRTGPTSDSFRHAMGAAQADEDLIYAVSPPHPFPPGSPIALRSRQSNDSRDKQRRKSMGSAMKSWFGLGKSESESPDGFDRERELLRRREEEDRRRVQDHYERLRQRESEANRNPSTPSSMRRGGAGDASQRVYSEYEPSYAPQCVPSAYDDYDLIGRYQAHRYDAAASSPSSPYYGKYSPSSAQQYHHHTYAPPAYHYPIPSSKSYHGPGTVSGPMHSSSSGERRSGERGQTVSGGTDSGARRRGPAPDYYHMFNSWFAYSGGGAIAAAPTIKAAYGAPMRSSGGGAALERADKHGGGWNRPSAYYAPPAEPSQLYANRFSNY